VIVFYPELLQFIFKHVDLLLEFTFFFVRSLFMAGMCGDTCLMSWRIIVSYGELDDGGVRIVGGLVPY